MKVSAAGGWYLGLWLLGLTLLLAGVNGVACQRSRPVVHSLAFGKGGGLPAALRAAAVVLSLPALLQCCFIDSRIPTRQPARGGGCPRARARISGIWHA